ncbi:ABC transporter substrate binding protein [Colwellia sp. RSH04]|uniref:ABC transporter substrate binding protein n=1 Tax=Colwellia sp. RSH04 TaxID=2305464 RepID=UPI0011C240AF|nr:ABC transporter substrate binding protein [Colwellia sp. RSH04]
MNVAMADETKSLQTPIQSIAIFYPRSKEPYRTIYQEIIEGIDSKANMSSQRIVFERIILEKSFDSEAIANDLKKNGITKAIVLGRLGWKLAKGLYQYKEDNGKPTFHIVSGALPISPNGLSGISLITAPSALFDYLTEVAPTVQNIHFAYSKQSEWLVDIARKAAHSKGLSLNTHKVTTTKEAFTYYKNLFNSDISNKDAIWLPVDRIASNDKVTLPLILEKSWSKEVVVFSSKPSHAKRGVLFSTYPDNFSMGTQLFTMVNELSKQPMQKNFSPLKSTLLAINLRTAAHLGFKYSSKQQETFKLTFPK